MKLQYFILAVLCPLLSMCQTIQIKGKVVNEEGRAVAGATVTVANGEWSMMNGGRKDPSHTFGMTRVTNEQGEFAFTNTMVNDTIIVSAAGYETAREPNNERGLVTITLHRKITALDEAVVIAYGSTTRRLNTGNVSKVSGNTIAQQPVNNLLGTLTGRVPGLEITQNSGVPGAGYKIQVRGQSSLTQGTEPLILIDGVPLGTGNAPLNNTNLQAVGGLSPLLLINPADIESIEVLKDADATAIYGSRGANGVIMISTKKGRVGKTQANLQLRSGMSRVTKTMELLNTTQYLAMRREAFANDGVAVTSSNAPDLLVWDTTRNTDFKKLFLGGTAHTTDATASISGGTGGTSVLLRTGYQKETGLYANDQYLQRVSVQVNLNHVNSNKKLQVQFTGQYSNSQSHLLQADLSSYINMAPHFKLYDAAGNLNWGEGGITYASLGLTNPLALLQRKYKGGFDYLNSRAELSYAILKTLTLRISQGYQLMRGDEQTLFPKSSFDPNSGQLAFANFSTTGMNSRITEPVLEYVLQKNKMKLTLLGGASWQVQENKSRLIAATDYTSDALLGSSSAAGKLSTTENYTAYRYVAGYGRATLQIDNRWLLNLTGRRDGSSRFGPGRRFANFGAAGAGWIFADERTAKKGWLKAISFGKLRASYGSSGNDQIGDYRYLNTWGNSVTNYQGVPGLVPTRLYNPDYGWETNRKAEVGAELGFFKNRLLITASYYRHRSDNQLVNYALPIQTGFTSVQQNFAALIQNSGAEITINYNIIANKNFVWNSSLTLTVPRNKLLSFPDLATTSYASTYEVGAPLSVKKTYQYLGVDAATGIYQFTDVDSNGVMDAKDKIIKVNTDARYYGGWQHSFSYKGFEAVVFFEFRQQQGRNYLATQAAFIPGYYFNNQPVIVLERWQKPGQVSNIQRFTAVTSSAAFRPAQNYLANSNAIYSDASYIRLKNVAISYTLPKKWMKGMTGGRLFIQAQNLLTITNYKGADPENQNLYVTPPMKTVVMGVEVSW